jgi:hypothetical protein
MKKRQVEYSEQNNKSSIESNIFGFQFRDFIKRRSKVLAEQYLLETSLNFDKFPEINKIEKTYKFLDFFKEDLREDIYNPGIGLKNNNLLSRKYKEELNSTEVQIIQMLTSLLEYLILNPNKIGAIKSIKQIFPYGSIEDILCRIKSGKLSVDVICVNMEIYFLKMDKLKERTMLLLPKAIQKIKESNLNTKAGLNLNRIIDVKWVVSDPMSNFTFSESRAKAYSADSGIIAFNTHFLEDAHDDLILNVVIHEILHEISGTALSKSNNKIKRYKAGLDTISVHNGAWINEAITEKIAISVSGCSGSTSYLRERFFLDNLLQLGLDFSLLESAYFENWESKSGNLKNDGINPSKSKYRRSVDQINRIYKLHYVKIIDSAKGIGIITAEESSNLLQAESESINPGDIGWSKIGRMFEFYNNRK